MHVKYLSIWEIQQFPKWLLNITFSHHELTLVNLEICRRLQVCSLYFIFMKLFRCNGCLLILYFLQRDLRWSMFERRKRRFNFFWLADLAQILLILTNFILIFLTYSLITYLQFILIYLFILKLSTLLFFRWSIRIYSYWCYRGFYLVRCLVLIVDLSFLSFL